MKLPLLRCLLVLFFIPAAAQSQPALFGVWEFRPAKSTDLALWRSRNPRLDIEGTEGEVAIRYTWLEGKNAAMVDSFRVRPGGPVSAATVKTRIWPDNWFMGVLAKQNVNRTASAQWQVPLRGLDLTTNQVVETSQGETTIRTLREFRLDTAGTALTVTERRSSRPTPIIMTFERIPEP
jgi:hypothetical protein